MPEWDVFHRKSDRLPEGSWVSISSRGDLTLSLDAFDSIGYPSSVELLFDKEGRRIGIRPADSIHSYKVGAGGKTIRRIAARAFAEHYGIPRSCRFKATVEEGVLVIDLNGPSTPVTSPRTGTGKPKETPDA